MSETRQCDHTLHPIDSAGQLSGTWIRRRHDGVDRIECAACGKVYGRVPSERRRRKTRRQPCPEQRRLA